MNLLGGSTTIASTPAAAPAPPRLSRPVAAAPGLPSPLDRTEASVMAPPAPPSPLSSSSDPLLHDDNEDNEAHRPEVDAAVHLEEMSTPTPTATLSTLLQRPYPGCQVRSWPDSYHLEPPDPFGRMSLIGLLVDGMQQQAGSATTAEPALAPPPMSLRAYDPFDSSDERRRGSRSWEDDLRSLATRPAPWHEIPPGDRPSSALRPLRRSYDGDDELGRQNYSRSPRSVRPRTRADHDTLEVLGGEGAGPLPSRSPVQ